jgi:hypothetical protein
VGKKLGVDARIIAPMRTLSLRICAFSFAGLRIFPRANSVRDQARYTGNSSTPITLNLHVAHSIST